MTKRYIKQSILEMRSYLVMSACCNELTLTIENADEDTEIKDLAGEYKYVFEESRIEEIEKGYFIYKHKDSKGFIFRTSNTSWSVSFNRIQNVSKSRFKNNISISSMW